MTTSPLSVITFTCNGYHLAVDSNFVERLTKGQKTGSQLNRKGMSIGLYQLNDEEWKVVELLGETSVGKTISIIILRNPENDSLLALQSDSIDQLRHQIQVQDSPVYENDISLLFSKSFVEGNTIYQLVDVSQLERRFPESANQINLGGSNKAKKDIEEIPLALNGRNWLTYGLSILHAQKRTGQFVLNGHMGEACIGLTLGHPTYASHGTEYGIEALQAIGNSQDWNGYHWESAEADAEPNISVSFDKILGELRNSPHACNN
ncbi:MAG: hypothetical protein AAF065_06795 [Verrucomicrobiota bacterium]